jgi:putative transposase
VGRRRACVALGRSRATHYRQRSLHPDRPARRSPSSPRALSATERHTVIEVLDSEEFCDLAPRQVWARLLDAGTYLCSVPMMYRLLAERGEVRERRQQARHPAQVKPELVATQPNQVWSWDITKLRGPYKWSWFYLYVILDVFSRYAIGWAVAPREAARLAEELIRACLETEGIGPYQLTIHADRGTSMTSKPVAHLLADLGVTRSHSRPHQSNDNPFSESQFKTLKYCPTFPHHFANIHDARAFIDRFFAYYNHQHRHCGLGLMTPADVHHQRTDTVIATRQHVLDDFYHQHPERFRHPPRAPRLPQTVWINKPDKATLPS